MTNEQIAILAEKYAEKIGLDIERVEILVGGNINPKGWTGTNLAGYCIPITTGREVIGAKVVISNTPAAGVVACNIGHELAHAKQFLTGRLISRSNHRIWEGTRYENCQPIAGKRDGGETYLNTPWERDARKHESPCFLLADELGLLD